MWTGWYTEQSYFLFNTWELRGAFLTLNFLFLPCNFSMWTASSRSSVALEPPSRIAFKWTIVVSFVLITGDCRNKLLNFKWLDVIVSFALHGEACWNGGKKSQQISVDPLRKTTELNFEDEDL